MLLTPPSWQSLWLSSGFSTKKLLNVPVPPQEKVLEDLKIGCCSPNKAVQLEALKCWGLWIKNQNTDDWKLKTVCFTSVRPLVSKKMQPLHKDVDICKLKLSLLWALLGRVQNLMQLEGPQYILEVFLQFCLSWLSCTSEDACENEVSVLIFQLVLSILNRNKAVSNFENEVLVPLTTDILHIKKIFHRLSDKFLSILIHWRKVSQRNMFLELWKHFLEHCEISCEHIPIPIWHKVFKLTDQICSDKNEPLKERLEFLHSCATTLKSTLSSSKFIDFGNLMTTPCEALFKNLVKLHASEAGESCDSEVFFLAKDTCQVLSDKSVAIGGFDLCISVLDVLEEFSIRELSWGVWCGLVHCYEVHLQNIDKTKMTKNEMRFYRKLRGVAINFELDREKLSKDCVKEVEKHIGVLKLNCICCLVLKPNSEINGRKVGNLEGVEDTQIVKVAPTPFKGQFTTVDIYKKCKLVPRIAKTSRADLIKDILRNLNVDLAKSFFNCLFNLQLYNSIQPIDITVQFKKDSDNNKTHLNLTVSCLKTKPTSLVPVCSSTGKNALVPYDGKPKREICQAKNEEEGEKEAESEEEVISTPKTRSRRRAEEEKKKELERLNRRKRRSFEVLVQEIVRKNKERKTEKNSRNKSPVTSKNKKNKRKGEKSAKNNTQKSPPEISERKLRGKKEEPKNDKKKGKKLFKTDGKLENYFKVITKKSEVEVKAEGKFPKISQKAKKEKKTKETKEKNCCVAEKEEGERKGEIGWRQTSLKTMMKRKNKQEKSKQKRNKPTDVDRIKDVTEEKPKPKESKITDSPLAKLSPFKEVFHDHEYAKIEPKELESFEKVLRAKQEKVAKKEPGNRKLIVEKPETVSPCRRKSVSGMRTEAKSPKRENSQSEEKSECLSEVQDPDVLRECKQGKKTEEKLVTETPAEKKDKDEECCDNLPIAVVADEKDIEKPNLDLPKKEVESVGKNVEQTPKVVVRKAFKRKSDESLGGTIPCKKMKLEEKLEEEEGFQEEKLPVEITEKENLEERQPKVISPTSGGPNKGETPLRASSGMISSRALRMIALVPESKGQMQREISPKVDATKCKKAPNVVPGSRASKMLALLSENVTEVEPECEEMSSGIELTTTPNSKSSLKSLKSVKRQKRFIRFDDAKNETVLYLTDTPPSQILEEKEKCRRLKSAEN